VVAKRKRSAHPARPVSRDHEMSLMIDQSPGAVFPRTIFKKSSKAAAKRAPPHRLSPISPQLSSPRIGLKGGSGRLGNPLTSIAGARPHHHQNTTIDPPRNRLQSVVDEGLHGPVSRGRTHLGLSSWIACADKREGRGQSWIVGASATVVDPRLGGVVVVGTTTSRRQTIEQV
jgi:hypothetical protein